jgi:hypothetical protein
VEIFESGKRSKGGKIGKWKRNIGKRGLDEK